jgi:hypothetical protein
MSSSAYEWDVVKPERWGNTLLGVFDVRKAKEIIAANPRPVREINIAGCAKAHEDVKIRDGTAENPAIDLDVPVIVVSTEYGPAIIDGWHRVAKALANGREVLNAVDLTADETALILGG